MKIESDVEDLSAGKDFIFFSEEYGNIRDAVAVSITTRYSASLRS